MGKWGAHAPAQLAGKEGAGSEGRQPHPWPRLQGLGIHEQITCYSVILTEQGDWGDVRALVTLGENESRGTQAHSSSSC